MIFILHGGKTFPLITAILIRFSLVKRYIYAFKPGFSLLYLLYRLKLDFTTGSSMDSMTNRMREIEWLNAS